MEGWGGTGAEALKYAIDNVCTGHCGQFKMKGEDHNAKLVSFTADGASVNFGKHTGLL